MDFTILHFAIHIVWRANVICTYRKSGIARKMTVAYPEFRFYKNRWQIELFFKWLKQHLKIKKFWGTTENAVRIQISSAIIAYCLVAIVQHDLQLKRSTYEVLQILSISLMDKTPLVDLFERTDFNNVKELGCPLFPGLFD